MHGGISADALRNSAFVRGIRARDDDQRRPVAIRNRIGVLRATSCAVAGTSRASLCYLSGKEAKVFNNSEYRIGAFAGLVALVLMLALTAMAFTALEPAHSASAEWDVSLPEPQATVVPTFR